MSALEDRPTEDSALKLIAPKHVRNAFHRVLAKPSLPPTLLFARADWSRFMQQVGAIVPVLSEAHQAAPAGNAALDALRGLSPEALQSNSGGAKHVACLLKAQTSW